MNILKNDAVATKTYRKVKKYIEDVGTWHPAYEDLAIVYAKAVSEYQKLTEQLDDEGTTQTDPNGITRRNPIEMVRNAAWDKMKESGKLLGLDRVYTEKMQVDAKDESKPDLTSGLFKVS